MKIYNKRTRPVKTGPTAASCNTERKDERIQNGKNLNGPMVRGASDKAIRLRLRNVSEDDVRTRLTIQI